MSVENVLLDHDWAPAQEVVFEPIGKWFGQYGNVCGLPAKDRTQSLSIKDERGKVLACCHPGWPQRAAISSLRDSGLCAGLSPQELGRPSLESTQLARSSISELVQTYHTKFESSERTSAVIGGMNDGS